MDKGVVKIKNIKIKGFKSFPDKTILDLDRNITGIVGPNGCGKSNIVDAIRWVVGEQKIKSLRSENLENLIFNGSKSRSASGLAEVNITFENTHNLLATEFNTVTISRRFYKTGESEYRLNGVVCRLKDIQNLLLDTGISSDSYAIIELGMIDDIIKDKDNSRRKMLEQAAGISIFKIRKRETELKLQATDQDLNRLEDILFEINNQLKDLESQSRRASKYIALRKTYKEISILYSKLLLKHVQETYNQQTQYKKEISEKVENLKTTLTKLNAQLEKEKLDYTQQEQSLRKSQLQLNELERQTSQVQNDKNLNEQQKVYTKDRQQESIQFIEDSKKQINYLEDSLIFVKKNINEEQKHSNTYQDNVQSNQLLLEQAKDVLSINKTSLAQILSQIQQIQKDRFELEKQLALYDAQRENNKLSLQKKMVEKEERLKIIADEEKQLNLYNKKVIADEEKLNHQLKSSDKTKEIILDLQAKIEHERTILNHLQRSQDAKQNEYNLLKNLIDSLEGYPDSVKYLYKHEQWKKAPLLSDVLFVKSEYRICIERYLEPYMSHYIVEDANRAHHAIELLEKNNKGKVNFFTLSTINTIQLKDTQTPKDCIKALSVIESDDSYIPLIKYLLHNVFIRQNEVSATQDQQELISIISKKGNWISKQDSISGGSVGAFEGKRIGRRKNVEKLNHKIIDFKKKINTQIEKIDAILKQVEQTNQKLNEQNTEQLQTEIIQTKERIENAKHNLEKQRNAITASNESINDLKTTIESIKVNAEKIATNLMNIKEKENQEYSVKVATEKTLEQQDHIYQNKQAEFNEAQINFTKHQNKINTLQNDLHHKQQQLQETQEQIEQKKNDVLQLDKIIQQCEQKTASIQENLIAKIKEKETVQVNVNQLSQSIDGKRNHIVEQEREVRKIQLQKETAEKEEDEIRKKESLLQLETTSIKERLLLEFKINIEDILEGENLNELDGNKEQLNEKIQKTKRSIENLGEVNPMAVEAYETHKKRYEFILKQKVDLEQAKDNLITTIKEVEKTANQNFNETFNQVRTYFQRVFKKLFTEEDTADLVLDKPDNFAETRIDIVAKPKGKRPASINQLSGGEKTLTSIALLFSLYLIKPAPFCVLDEVDAPLDDANVIKFIDMIREFSESSQFVIVTHNKVTMSSLDVIYGVTMQETGVSKIVPVDFRSLHN